ERLSLGLSWNGPTPTIPVQLQLFDEAGNSLGQWSSGASSGSLPFHTDVGPLPVGSVVYISIASTSSDASGAASGSAGYLLWVSRQPARHLAPAGFSTATILPVLASSPTIVAPLSASIVMAAIPARGESTSPGATGAPVIGPGESPVAVGLLTVRSAGPSGGALFSGDPAPPADHTSDMSTLEARSDRPQAGTDLERSIEGGSMSGSGRAENPDALIVMNEPGGFPLLGAVATGHRHGRPGEDQDDLEALLSNEPVDPQLGDVAVAGEAGATDAGDARGELRELGLSAQTWSGFPLSVFSGFGLATVLTLNAVLSQPIAGYDYLRSRLETRDLTPLPPRR